MRPAPLPDHPEPPFVPDVLAAVGAVVVAVVLDGDIDVLPPHVEERECGSIVVNDRDLRCGAGKFGIDQEESEAGLLR